MAYDVVIAGPAEDDLERAIAYIAVALGAPAAASDLADEFGAKLDALRDNPLLYGVNSEVSSAVGAEVRRCPVKRYAAWYTIDEQARRVAIVAFLHSMRDAPRLLERRVAAE